MFEEFLHQAFIVLGSGLDQCFVQLHGFIFLFSRNFFDDRCTAFGCPRVLLHQQHVYQRVEVGTGSQRILNRNYFGTVDGLQLFKHHIIITLLVIELIHQEDHRFTQFLGIAEVVLSSHFGSILSVQQQNCCIRYIECCHGSAYKVIAARAVYDVQFLPVPFYMEDGRKDRISIFLFYRKVIAYGVFGSDSAATFYNTTLIEQRFCESGFS